MKLKAHVLDVSKFLDGLVLSLLTACLDGHVFTDNKLGIRHKIAAT